MNQLQAAMRDKSAKTWPERKRYYKVGSVFKGCFHCGEFEVEEGSTKRRYTSGTMVFRSYLPRDIGWTYKCWECGAVDEACWENAIDVGYEPILGARDTVRKLKKSFRKKAKGDGPPNPANLQKIADLRSQVAMLENMLKLSKGAR